MGLINQMDVMGIGTSKVSPRSISGVETAISRKKP
jgi:hypothetical protein